MLRQADGNPQLISSFVETSIVEFSPLSNETIEAYIKTGEPFDKGSNLEIYLQKKKKKGILDN